MNCHPAGDHPLQGADNTSPCHPYGVAIQGAWRPIASAVIPKKNVTLHDAASYKSIPGHPRWGVAPLSMAWEGKSLGEICRQLKDANLKGGRDLALLQKHIAKDDLVAWG